MPGTSIPNNQMPREITTIIIAMEIIQPVKKLLLAFGFDNSLPEKLPLHLAFGFSSRLERKFEISIVRIGVPISIAIPIKSARYIPPAIAACSSIIELFKIP